MKQFAKLFETTDTQVLVQHYYEPNADEYVFEVVAVLEDVRCAVKSAFHEAKAFEELFDVFDQVQAEQFVESCKAMLEGKAEAVDDLPQAEVIGGAN